MTLHGEMTRVAGGMTLHVAMTKAPLGAAERDGGAWIYPWKILGELGGDAEKGEAERAIFDIDQTPARVWGTSGRFGGIIHTFMNVCKEKSHCHFLEANGVIFACPFWALSPVRRYDAAGQAISTRETGNISHPDAIARP
jgi:hypothetical protein